MHIHIYMYMYIYIYIYIYIYVYSKIPQQCSKSQMVKKIKIIYFFALKLLSSKGFLSFYSSTNLIIETKNGKAQNLIAEVIHMNAITK